MVFLLSFAELAECWGVSIDTATRIASRDLPVTELHGRGGDRPIRGVELEAVYRYMEHVTITDSALAVEIQRDLVTARLRRLEAARESRGERREEAMPELVRAHRDGRRSKVKKPTGGAE